ncbi:MAG: hypothetical protein JSS66_11140 [Armatimonadetes bacterium]|nr:hypothetical protein [Armatimonadota bacterium]
MTEAQTGQGGIPLKVAVPVLIGLCLLVCLPIWLVKYPPLVDWPLHSARWYLLSLPQNGEGITEFYQTRFQPIPNLGMDLLMMVVMKFVPPLFASKLAACLVLIGLLTGGFAFSAALHKQVTWAAFLPVLALYDQWFLMGFANYLLGLGIAFWAVAVWLWSEEWPKPRRWAVLGLLGAVLLVTHLMALAVAVLVVGVFLMSKHLPNSAAKWLLPGIVVGCVVMAAGLSLIGKTPYSWGGKLQTLDWLLRGPSDVVFVLVAAIGFTECFTFERRAVLSAAALLVLAILGPSFLGGTAFACDRLTLPFTVVLFVGLGSGAQRLGQRTFAMACTTTIVVGLASICLYLGRHWMGSSNSAVVMLGAHDELTVGALDDLADRSTLVTYDLKKHSPITWQEQRHVPDWILLERPVFVAQNFAKNRQQPMIFKPEFEEFHRYQNNNPVVLKTWEELSVELPKVELLQSNLNRAYEKSGRQPTDLYILAMTNDPSQPSPEGTEKVDAGKDFVLLKVDSDRVRP